MLVATEAEAKEIIDEQAAYECVEAVFRSMDAGTASNFPVVREELGFANAIFGVKSAFDAAGETLGLKFGGYWPGNAAQGHTNHQSTIVLLDASTGMARAVVSANYLTAVRTAAATAVSVDALSRKDAKTLGVVGAGGQVPFQIRAIAKVRPIERVVVWNRTESRIDALRESLADIGPIEYRPIEEVAATDVVLTITSASEALLQCSWIQPGTHIAAMGVDTAGKQELDPQLVASSRVFVDSREQACQIGECQHAINEKLIAPEAITEIGAVLNGRMPGRTSNDEITLFDGTGVALQDLAVAGRLVSTLESKQRA